MTVYDTALGDMLNHSVIRTSQSNDYRNYFGLDIVLGRNVSHAKFEVINIHVQLNTQYCTCTLLLCTVLYCRYTCVYNVYYVPFKYMFMQFNSVPIFIIILVIKRLM